MGIEQLIVITFGALAGGFVSGLVGFGTGITAISIWLYAVSPPVAASLVVVCSIIAQVQTLPTIWRSIEAKRVLPFILPGIFGVPLGTVLLSHLDTRILKLAIGGLLAVILCIHVVWQITCEERMGRSDRGWYDWFRRWRSRWPCRLIGTATNDVGDY
jgi:uncharacterized membrane protein YfcA